MIEEAQVVYNSIYRRAPLHAENPRYCLTVPASFTLRCKFTVYVLNTVTDEGNIMSIAARSYNSPMIAQRREAMLAATRELLTEQGFDCVTMNAVAERAGVVKKTLYNTFGSKDELLLAAIGEVIADYRDLSPSIAPGFASIRASRLAAIDQVLTNPAYARAMTISLMQADNDHPLVAMLMRDAVRFTRAQLAAETTLLATDTDTDALAKQIVAQSWGMIVLLTKGIVEPEQFRSQSMAGLDHLLKTASHF